MNLADPVVFEGVHKSFSKQVALSGLSFSLSGSGIHLLAGPNGAGKTTTLRLAIGLTRRDNGRISVFGLDPTDDGPQIRSIAGYVAEDRQIGYDWMKIEELLGYHALHYEGWDSRYAHDLLYASDIGLSQRFGTLSKGQARIVNIVLALCHRPAFLVLDEPLDGLDPSVRLATQAQLEDHVSKYQSTVLFSTHHLQEVSALAQTLTVVSHGSIVSQHRMDSLVGKVHAVKLDTLDEFPEMPGTELIGVRRGTSQTVYYVRGSLEDLRRRLKEFEVSGVEVVPATTDEIVSQLMIGL